MIDLHTDEESGKIGLFRSWTSLYVAVVAYTVALVLVLYLFTVLLDFSAR